MESFTMENVVEMADISGSYIVVANNKVYDVSKMLSRHPGGKYVITSNNSKDITKHYKTHSFRAKKMWVKYQIGNIMVPGCCKFT
jgi:cytochrome b involved in lipid metabolism